MVTLAEEKGEQYLIIIKGTCSETGRCVQSCFGQDKRVLFYTIENC